jgi:hypothetical protein
MKLPIELTNKISHYDIFKNALTEYIFNIYNGLEVGHKKCMLIAINNNPDRFTCIACHYQYIDNLNENMLFDHYEYCPGYESFFN